LTTSFARDRDRALDPESAGDPGDGAADRAAPQAQGAVPELTSMAFTEWCTNRGIDARFIQPGKPDQNAFIERFNKTYRDEMLDAYVFESVEQVREGHQDMVTRIQRGAAP